MRLNSKKFFEYLEKKTPISENKQKQLISTWDYLVDRIVKDHPARRMPEFIRADVEKEFLRVARALAFDTGRMFSCRILAIENYHFDNSQITIKSRGGFAVNIYEEDYPYFLMWATPEPEEEDD